MSHLGAGFWQRVKNFMLHGRENKITLYGANRKLLGVTAARVTSLGTYIDPPLTLLQLQTFVEVDGDMSWVRLSNPTTCQTGACLPVQSNWFLITHAPYGVLWVTLGGRSFGMGIRSLSGPCRTRTRDSNV